MIKVLFTVELAGNVNIFTKLAAEIQGLLLRQFRNREEGIDLIGFLVAPHLLQGDVDHGDELGREVPLGVGVDEVPLLRIDLSAVFSLSSASDIVLGI